MSKKKKIKPVHHELDGNLDLSNYTLCKDLQGNIDTINTIFKDDDTIIKREFENGNNGIVKFCIFFIDGMVNIELINENIMKPLLYNKIVNVKNDILNVLEKQVIMSSDVKKAKDYNDIVQAIVYGDTVLFIDGVMGALIISTKGWENRSINEPDDEKSLRGPREGFTESLLVNISMIRRKMRTSDLKIKYQSMGTRTNTQICICYLEGLVDKKVLKELERRLKRVKIDGIIDSNYILECIKDAPMDSYKTIGVTEKPDVVTGKLLEGRIALIVDGTPVALTIPFIFVENFQVPDDYYLNFYFASIGRLLRIIGFLISISVPAIYVALTTYHREMIPTHLAINIAMARQGVPMPTFVECVVMLLVFEIIRETGIRMPSNIGQALSVVGALVIGQAAVDAKFVSAPMVIVVSITAITGLINPRIKATTIMLRSILLILSTILGLYGFFFGCIGILIHILGIRSFGIDYTTQLISYKLEPMKDIFVRSTWSFMRTRPKFQHQNKQRKS